MTTPIADYALIGDCQTAALVSRDGSIDWACFPRFDSGACFAALLGEPRHGHWRIAPSLGKYHVERHYEPGGLVLVTEFKTAQGTVRLTDFMPLRGRAPDIVRIVTGLQGQVAIHMDLIIRFDYGKDVPWVTKHPKGGLTATCGPDRLRLSTSVPLESLDLTTVADFMVAEGQTVAMVMTWYPSHEEEPALVDAQEVLEETREIWRNWIATSAKTPAVAKLPPVWREAVDRSLITLKAMTYAPTGGLVAAVTTSLPELLGGSRNWDYRYCWLRDATLSLGALERGGYTSEAASWYRWLLRAAAGQPEAVQIMYGLAGERRLSESTVDWLPGYANSKPVRLGNGAADQFQLDVYGEVLDALFIAAQRGVEQGAEGWALQRALIAHVEKVWREPDCGIWEVRGGPRHFTHSKVMGWVAMDRAITSAETCHLEAPLDRWRALRAQMHAEICLYGYDEASGTFVQAYDRPVLDASLLRLPLVGFLPADDPRMKRTIEAIEQRLVKDGLVLRYKPDGVDGLAGSEGVFLACSFWLADCLALIDRKGDAIRLFERLLALRNDVGLLAEEFDVETKQQVGNFPQAFSHLSLINTAMTLAE